MISSILTLSRDGLGSYSSASVVCGLVLCFKAVSIRLVPRSSLQSESRYVGVNGEIVKLVRGNSGRVGGETILSFCYLSKDPVCYSQGWHGVVDDSAGGKLTLLECSDLCLNRSPLSTAIDQTVSTVDCHPIWPTLIFSQLVLPDNGVATSLPHLLCTKLDL